MSAGPLRSRCEQRLVPDLRLRACVGEDQRRGGGLDLAGDGLDHLDSEMPAPGEAARFVGQQGVDDDLLGHGAADQHASCAGQQHLQRVLGVAEGGREAPHRRLGRRVGSLCHRWWRIEPTTPGPRLKAGDSGALRRALARKHAQAGECELQLHAALVAHQLVPLVDDDEFDTSQQRGRVGACQQQGQAFGRGHQRLGQALRLARAFAGLGVPGAHTHLPVEAQLRQRRFECTRGVCRQGTHRCQPQQAQAATTDLARERAIQQAEPDRVGLAAARRCMQQARAAGGDVLPDLTLERKRLPALGSEPALGAWQGQLPATLRRRFLARFRCGFSGTRLQFSRQPCPPRPQLSADVRARWQSAALLGHGCDARRLKRISGIRCKAVRAAGHNEHSLNRKKRNAARRRRFGAGGQL